MMLPEMSGASPQHTTRLPLGILLLSAGHDRALFAFAMAAGGAALGREVVLFATGHGCRALLDDWSGLEDVGRDAVIRGRGVTGFGAMREAARETGVRLLVCETGLKAEALEQAVLLDGVTVAGIATFLEAVGAGQIVSL
jgi:predicted peroxiredoxin